MIDPTQPDFGNTPASAERPRFDYAPADAGALPGVTIVTPYFNTGTVFHETAHTVFGQSFQQWEWLIIDDASTDPAALEVLATYEGADPRVRVIRHKTNRGLSAARNTGFAEARAPYVVQLDSDDLIEPTAVEAWLWFLDSHPHYGFVKGFTVGFGAEEYLWRMGFHDRQLFLRRNFAAATSMVRVSVHRDAGGYDENNRAGFEDWDFWLRCASAGHWGDTVPQFLDWYRRRASHKDRWANWEDGGTNRSFQHTLKRRYPHLWNGGFPKPAAPRSAPQPLLPDEWPYPNRLRKAKPRLLFVVPWLNMGGADKFNVDVVRELSSLGWEITIATTLQSENPWLPRFTSLTPDVFVLPSFLPVRDYPRFLTYLIESRQIDLVLISNSEFAYRVLPWLRSRCPNVPVVDYCHMEEEHWNEGGHPRFAVDYHHLIDLNLVSSEHLKRWMVARGSQPDRVRVCSTNVDTQFWRPDPEVGARLRRRLRLPRSVPLILYCARICDQKQPQVFARTLRALAANDVPFTALVAGDGPDEEWLQGYLWQVGLQNQVRLLGAQPNDRIRDLLQAADVFFLPSKWEGIALSIFEAMACGVAVVGADVGGQRELVTPDCGILLPPADPDTEVERYAATLAALFKDPGERAAIGARARARVESFFQLHQMAERLVTLFDDAARVRAESPRTLPHSTLARITATQAVQYYGLAAAFDSIRQRELDRRKRQRSWRARTYFGVQRLLLPAYRMAVQHDANWLVPLKNRLKRALLHTTDDLFGDAAAGR